LRLHGAIVKEQRLRIVISHTTAAVFRQEDQSHLVLRDRTVPTEPRNRGPSAASALPHGYQESRPRVGQTGHGQQLAARIRPPTDGLLPPASTAQPRIG